MQVKTHPLVSPATGTQRQVISWHYGAADAPGPHVYLQASLHADELPGMLVLQHLKHLLDAADASGQIKGRVTVVPVANPIGLDQTLMYAQLGRFELGSGKNFNRHYPNLAAIITPMIADQLSSDAQQNTRIIRDAMHAWLRAQTPRSELESLRNTLLDLAVDADVVLDLHCDFEAVMHLYVEAPYLVQAEPLMRHMRAETVLWANDDVDATMVGDLSGGLCFDEALSSVWWRLRAAFPQMPINLACLSSTIELRGQQDVSHALAGMDAQNLMAYFKHIQVIDGTPDPLPPALCHATPLAGSETLEAPHPGVLVYLKQVGERVKVGDAVAQIVEPFTGKTTDICATVAGTLYARQVLRWATTGLDIGKIAGSEAFKTGQLLSA